MLRGFVTDVRQEAILIEAGVKDRAIYRNDLARAVISLRAGDMIAVTGLRVFGKTRLAIDKGVDSVHAKKCFVLDVTTGLTTEKHRKKLTDSALKDLANSRRGPSKAKKKRQMPLDQVAKFWFDKTLRNEQVMDAVNSDPRYPDPWSHPTLWRKLGKRNAITGRPSKR